jgi:dTDP-D-glucose 4,6-dehydratase
MANLPWRPQWSFHTAVRRTMEWYLAFYRGENRQELRNLCRRQIAEYESKWMEFVVCQTEEGAEIIHESSAMSIM